MSSLPLFDEPPAANELDRRYRAWRSEHRDVFDLFLRFARDLAERRRPFGVKMLVERVRWEVHMRIEKDADGYRLNNNLTAYLARDLVRRLPELRALIETRRVDGEHA